MRHILIVDDDEEDLEFIREAVHEVQPTVKCIFASNCREALITLQLRDKPTPDLIFMDINMPGIDGLQCLGEIKKNQLFQNIPFVMYTGSSQKDDRAKAEATGAAYYLEKPNSFADLLKTVRHIFEKEML